MASISSPVVEFSVEIQPRQYEKVTVGTKFTVQSGVSIHEALRAAMGSALRVALESRFLLTGCHVSEEDQAALVRIKDTVPDDVTSSPVSCTTKVEGGA